MGASASSLFNGRAARRRGYERIPPHDEEQLKEEEEVRIRRHGEEHKEKEKMRIPRHRDGEADHKVKEQRPILFEEERQGPAALEALGRMLRDRARRQTTAFATWKDIKDSALFYLLALNWRKAGLGFCEQAVYELQLGHRQRAGTAFLRSAKCYIEIENKREDEVAYVKHALGEATALFAGTGELRLAAASCKELGDFCMDQQDLRGALGAFERGAGYCGGRVGHCRLMANVVRPMLRHEKELRRQGLLPIEDYKRRYGGYIRSSDPDCRSKVANLYYSTFHDAILLRRARLNKFEKATDPAASIRQQSPAVRLPI